MQQLRERGVRVQPVETTGQTIARGVWGRRWCEHLDAAAGGGENLPLGPGIVRRGAVCHLEIRPGAVEAMVAGSSLFRVVVRIPTLAPAAWKGIRAACGGRIASLAELLEGRLPDAVVEAVTDPARGLLPQPGEMESECGCSTRGALCRHAAAALYGVGSRLDAAPELLFRLRGVDPAELVTGGAASRGARPAHEAMPPDAAASTAPAPPAAPAPAAATPTRTREPVAPTPAAAKTTREPASPAPAVAGAARASAATAQTLGGVNQRPAPTLRAAGTAPAEAPASAPASARERATHETAAAAPAPGATAERPARTLRAPAPTTAPAPTSARANADAADNGGGARAASARRAGRETAGGDASARRVGRKANGGDASARRPDADANGDSVGARESGPEANGGDASARRASRAANGGDASARKPGTDAEGGDVSARGPDAPAGRPASERPDPDTDANGDGAGFRPTGAEVRQLRETAGFSVAEFAELLQVSAGTVRRWEAAAGPLTLRSRPRDALRTLQDAVEGTEP